MNEQDPLEIPVSDATPPPLPEPAPLKAFSIDDVQEPAMTADDAWHESTEHAFDGKELKPFTASRQRLMEKMGCAIFNEGEKCSEQFQSMGKYIGMDDDSSLAVFVCTKTIAEVAHYRMNIEKASLHFVKWEDKIGVGYDSERGLHAECLRVWGQILNELFASESEPEDTGASGAPVEPGKPPESPTGQSSAH